MEVGKWKWEVGMRKWEDGSGKSECGSGKMEVGSWNAVCDELSRIEVGKKQHRAFYLLGFRLIRVRILVVNSLHFMQKHFRH